MRPFFPYFGSKWRLVPRYPPPEHRLIVEAFAGSACYATRHAERRVLLIDADPVVVGVWRYLIAVRPAELLAIPDVRDHVDELAAWPPEARWLVGFWLDKGNARPSQRPSSWMRRGDRCDSFWGPAIRRRLADQVARIRHWKVAEGSFESAPDVRATWFVDPPYSGPCGRRYRHGRRGLQYSAVAHFCRDRRGLVIACEQAGAGWLPFRPLCRARSTHGTAYSNEAVWIGREPLQLALWADVRGHLPGRTAPQPLVTDCAKPVKSTPSRLAVRHRAAIEELVGLSK